MEKTHLKFCYIYINNASITPKYAFSVNKWIHFGIMSYMYANNSKFIKKNIPLNFDQHPPPLKHNDVAAREEVV